MCGKIQSNRDFLKSAQGKIINNKRKAEPDMRVEALLGSACKRIRCEIKSQNSEKNRQAVREIIPNNLDSIPDLSSLLTSSSFTFECDYNDNRTDNFVGLLDDPKQVEMFLQQVESQCQTDTNKDENHERKDNFDSFPDISEKPNSPTESIHSEFDLFYSNFESLYDELIDSLASVEKWMTLASADNTNMEKNSSYLSTDQNEAIIDLSALFDIAK